MIRMALPLAWICLVVGGEVAFAQNPTTITMKSVLSVSSKGLVQIDGGDKEPPDKWKSTFAFNGPAGLCTGTLIGPQTLITAAHCLIQSAKYQLQLTGGAPIKLECTLHDKTNVSALRADIALCKAMKNFPDSSVYERLDLVSLPQIGKRLFLLGFGCRNIVTLAASTQGHLYGGFATVSGLATDDNDHVITNGGVVICPGDSGGAAYRLTDDKFKYGPRSIVGINSGFAETDRISGITAFTSDNIRFVTDWAKTNAVRLCGLHPDTPKCRPN